MAIPPYGYGLMNRRMPQPHNRLPGIRPAVRNQGIRPPQAVNTNTFTSGNSGFAMAAENATHGIVNSGPANVQTNSTILRPPDPNGPYASIDLTPFGGRRPDSNPIMNFDSRVPSNFYRTRGRDGTYDNGFVQDPDTGNVYHQLNGSWVPVGSPDGVGGVQNHTGLRNDSVNSGNNGFATAPPLQTSRINSGQGGVATAPVQTTTTQQGDNFGFGPVAPNDPRRSIGQNLPAYFQHLPGGFVRDPRTGFFFGRNRETGNYEVALNSDGSAEDRSGWDRWLSLGGAGQYNNPSVNPDVSYGNDALPPDLSEMPGYVDPSTRYGGPRTGGPGTGGPNTGGPNTGNTGGPTTGGPGTGPGTGGPNTGPNTGGPRTGGPNIGPGTGGPNTGGPNTGNTGGPTTGGPSTGGPGTGGTGPTTGNGPGLPGGTGGPTTATQADVPGFGDANTRTNPYRSLGGWPIDMGVFPGTTGNVNYDNYNDFFTNILSALASRGPVEFGNGLGNEINDQGQWDAPDWLTSSPNLVNTDWMQNILGDYSGANEGAQTRSVQGDETVESRLNGLMREDSEYLKIARDRANEEAASRGMLGSSYAVGNAVRAAREAALPIAQQDATWAGQTARENMDSINRDRLSDQSNKVGLLSQRNNLLADSQRQANDINAQQRGLMANLYESASDRKWRADENNTQRTYQTAENELAFRRGSLDREDQQQYNWLSREDQQDQELNINDINNRFNVATREDQQDHESYMNDINHRFDREMRELDQEFQGNQSERERMQTRVRDFYNATFGREGVLGGVLQSIYNNPNFTAAQAGQAAANARALFESLWETFNATLANGIPQIFVSPYGTPVGAGG